MICASRGFNLLWFKSSPTEHPFMVDTLPILLKAASPPVNPTLADSNKDVTWKIETPGIFTSKVF